MTTPAVASDDAFELWLNPSISTDLDDDTSIELETAQRFRSAADGRVDTYFFRGWVKQQVSDEFTLAGAVEKRFNDGSSDELRTMQQLSGKHGIFRTRVRLEQRFVEDRGGRMGLRLRPRAGISLPLGDNGKWSVKTDAELFWTLRGTSPGSDTGITGLRTQIGTSYDISDQLSLSLTYLRQQSFRDNAPDRVGHAPLLGVEFSF
ncbi:DUF2490 domain-containing protein [Pontixanthobacter aestiaquae]|uniref:DUF2490 domain-containing protein n=1 Tax=Pontixanthobacter aestiaquae TaxID=1509367 RepID=A0A844Z611_9SPHN|nr:DUF2490 domain-containing protein [Pontixanthobacter aestiaquae]MDN3644918.1 DUF2490 domain-containing protein [Pontixanthobacter aestiaquae]MXO84081.1 DUF2490 domain-containing protein [Pontixanthobacter aestiaquae]